MFYLLLEKKQFDFNGHFEADFLNGLILHLQLIVTHLVNMEGRV